MRQTGWAAGTDFDVKSHARTAGQYQATVRNIMQLLSQQRIDEAVSACLAFSESNPNSNDALLLLGKRILVGIQLVDRLQQTGFVRPDHEHETVTAAGKRNLVPVASKQAFPGGNGSLLLLIGSMGVGVKLQDVYRQLPGIGLPLAH